MAWVNLSIFTNNELADQLSDQLLELGAVSTSIQDKNLNQNNEEMIFGEPHNGPQEFWQHNQIDALFDSSVDLQSLIKSLEKNTGVVFDYLISDVKDEDWVKKSQKQFSPIRIEKNFWIVPSWHEVINENAINLVLDPGLAFGTGSHPTTHLCLEWLIKNVSQNSSVLDYGCGSGVLSIAAKKLNAKDVYAVDIDEQALQASQDNAKSNRVNIKISHVSIPVKIQADLVVANILSSALSVLAPALANYCKARGKIALSGILEAQENEIKAIYQQWFDFEESFYKDGWVCINGIKVK